MERPLRPFGRAESPPTLSSPDVAVHGFHLGAHELHLRQELFHLVAQPMHLRMGGAAAIAAAIRREFLPELQPFGMIQRADSDGERIDIAIAIIFAEELLR